MEEMRPKESKIVCRAAAPFLLFAFFISAPAWASSDCDKALSIFWKGRYSANEFQAYRNYEIATELCPGFIRPSVSNASRQAQTPLFGRLEGEGEFLFFVKPAK
jgi:hypothetical protein